MGRILPILFNTDMVRAILEDRKTATRRVVKKKNMDVVLNSPVRKENPNIPDRDFIKFLVNAPYRKGNFLYVRETYCPDYFDFITKYGNKHAYKADYDHADLSSDIAKPIWTPSIHMPKEAARIWLKVVDVGVERLQEIDGWGILAEGIDNGKSNPANGKRWENMQRTAFSELWNSTIKKSDISIYGWDANPWVWTIKFERCEKPE